MFKSISKYKKYNLILVFIIILGIYIFNIHDLHLEYYWSQAHGILKSIETGTTEYTNGELSVKNGQITEFGRTVVLECGFTEDDIQAAYAVAAENNVGNTTSSESSTDESSSDVDNTSSEPKENTSNSSSSSENQNLSKPIYTEDEINAAWEETNRVESTCTEAGYIEYTNSLTNETKTEELELAKHQYKEAERIEPTCTEDGSVTYTCSVCGNTYDESISATGHSYEWVTTKEVGLFVDGLEEEVCSVCGEKSGATHTVSAKCPIPLIGMIGLFIIVCGGASGLILYKKRKKMLS